MTLYHGYTKDGVRHDGLKDVKKALDAGKIKLRDAKRVRDELFLAAWERVRKAQEL